MQGYVHPGGWRPLRLLAWLLFLLLGMALMGQALASQHQVDVLRVKGPISPALAGYIQRGIGAAESHNAAAVVIQLDTPGGLDSAMRDIIQRIIASRVPVVVYVSPGGARAASAGTFITLAAHVAAMAPGTEIGAASPVTLGGQPTSETLERKVTNDAAAYIRSLADMRGRNADWAEKAVREGASLQAEAALKEGVIDLVVPTLEDLLGEIHGMKVKLLAGEKTLETRGARVNFIDMNLVEEFLFTISNPNIAFILLNIGILGIIFELSNPGAIFPGVIGGISMLLGLYSLGTMGANWVGLLLIFAAFAMFIAEIFTPTFGILTAGGLVSLVLGALLLTGGNTPPGLQIDPRLIAGVTLSIAAFLIFVIRAIVQAHRQKPALGYQGLTGKVAVARTPLNPEGIVFLEGERWQALAEDGPVEAGEEVVIKKVQGMKVWVTKRKENT